MATAKLLDYGYRDGNDVYGDCVLTLEACLCLARTEKVEDSGKRARRAAAGVREDEDEDDDSGLPVSIPCTWRTRKMTWSLWFSSVCSGTLQSMAASSKAMAARVRFVRKTGEKREQVRRRW